MIKYEILSIYHINCHLEGSKLSYNAPENSRKHIYSVPYSMLTWSKRSYHVHFSLALRTTFRQTNDQLK